MSGDSGRHVLAVVTLNRDKVGGQAPIFYADNEEELQETALLIARPLMAAIHDLKNGSLIIVRH